MGSKARRFTSEGRELERSAENFTEGICPKVLRDCGVRQVGQNLKSWSKADQSQGQRQRTRASALQEGSGAAAELDNVAAVTFGGAAGGENFELAGGFTFGGDFFAQDAAGIGFAVESLGDGSWPSVTRSMSPMRTSRDGLAGWLLD
jgi:hypothetical protein